MIVTKEFEEQYDKTGFEGYVYRRYIRDNFEIKLLYIDNKKSKYLESKNNKYIITYNTFDDSMFQILYCSENKFDDDLKFIVKTRYNTLKECISQFNILKK